MREGYFFNLVNYISIFVFLFFAIVVVFAVSSGEVRGPLGNIICKEDQVAVFDNDKGLICKPAGDEESYSMCPSDQYIVGINENNYNSATTYSIGDRVKNRGKVYESKKDDNIGKSLTSTNYWKVYIDVYDSNNSYSKNEIVSYNGVYYKSKVNNNTATPTTSSEDFWEVHTEFVCVGFGDIGTCATTTENPMAFAGVEFIGGEVKPKCVPLHISECTAGHYLGSDSVCKDCPNSGSLVGFATSHADWIDKTRSFSTSQDLRCEIGCKTGFYKSGAGCVSCSLQYNTQASDLHSEGNLGFIYPVNGSWVNTGLSTTEGSSSTSPGGRCEFRCDRGYEKRTVNRKYGCYLEISTEPQCPSGTVEFLYQATTCGSGGVRFDYQLNSLGCGDGSGVVVVNGGHGGRISNVVGESGILIGISTTRNTETAGRSLVCDIQSFTCPSGYIPGRLDYEHGDTTADLACFSSTQAKQ